MNRRYHMLDVFTDRALSGNPLAVVSDAQGLDAARMQAIAREFNLSETVFVLEPRDPVNTAAIRIFTPVRELPFAGHPTVGAAVLIAQLRAPEMIGARDLGIVLEEQVGIVSCTVRRPRGQVARASFDLPKLPIRLDAVAPVETIARALGIAVADIGFDAHVPARFDAGVPYTCVPVKSRAVLAALRPDSAQWDAAFRLDDHNAAYIYTRETVQAGHAYATRMFVPFGAIIEDPATGSAAACFAGAIAAFDAPADGDHTLVIEQGYDMGRPSLITLGIDMARGQLAGASIGGAAVIVAEGTLHL